MFPYCGILAPYLDDIPKHASNPSPCQSYTKVGVKKRSRPTVHNHTPLPLPLNPFCLTPPPPPFPLFPIPLADLCVIHFQVPDSTPSNRYNLRSRGNTPTDIHNGSFLSNMPSPSKIKELFKSVQERSTRCYSAVIRSPRNNNTDNTPLFSSDEEC